MLACMCKLRSKKFSFSGAADYDIALYDKSIVSRRKRVSVPDCRKIHRGRYILNMVIEHYLNSTRTLTFPCTPKKVNILTRIGMMTNVNVKVK